MNITEGRAPTMLGEDETLFFCKTGSIATPMTFALLGLFAIAVAAFMLWRGFCTAWAAIRNGD
jgi:hypothetical protein